jgi:hypothetical protein
LISLAQAKPLDPHRVQMHIPAQLQPPLPGLHQHRLVAALKKMTHAPVTSVEPNRVADIQPLHDHPQGDVAALHNQMIVIRHQHISVDQHTESLRQLRHQFQPVTPVRIGAKNNPPLIAASRHMMPGAGKINAQRSSHTQANTARQWCQLLNVEI